MTLSQYKAAFRKTAQSSYRQYGLDKVREAEALVGRNDARVAEIVGSLWYVLGCAQEVTKRTAA